MLCDVLVYEKFRPMIFLEMSDIRCTKKGEMVKEKILARETGTVSMTNVKQI
jgi:hypothetical protein